MIDVWTEQANMHERAGRVPEAIDSWWVVHAVSTTPELVEAHILALEQRTRRLVQPMLVSALKHYRAGNYRRALNNALAVLRSDAENVEAMTLLRRLEKRRAAKRMMVTNE
ncbi:MAG: hypothetical protein AAF918_16285 [Pseudomonadota bacterium]